MGVGGLSRVVMGRPCATAVVVTVGPAVRVPVAARATNGGTATTSSTRHCGLIYTTYRYVCMLLPLGLFCGCKGFVSVLKYRGFCQ